jgi:hypothetical protein
MKLSPRIGSSLSLLDFGLILLATFRTSLPGTSTLLHDASAHLIDSCNESSSKLAKNISASVGF